MQNKHIFINVYLNGLGYTPCGVITFNENIDASSFSYFESYTKENHPSINPATLNWKTSGDRHFILKKDTANELLDKTFWELIPNENDWADQVLSERYTEYPSMTKLQKLYFLQNREVGGLNSYLTEEESEQNIDSLSWLEKVRDQSINFYLRNIEKITYIKAIKPLTGYGGIRPKCMFIDEKNDYWIVKFNTPTDKFSMSKFEKTTLDMAKDIGVQIAESKILTLPSGEEVFMSKRFDRLNEERFHSLSIFALMEPKTNKEKNGFQGNESTRIKTVLSNYSDYKTKDMETLVTKMLIDIALNNTDNHMRNMRLLLNREHKWELSPFYDIVANHYEQHHVYNPIEENKSEIRLDNPNLAEIISKKFGVNNLFVREKIEQCKEVVSNWEIYCDRNKMCYEDKVKFCEAMNVGFSNIKSLKIKSPKTVLGPELKPKLKPK